MELFEAIAARHSYRGAFKDTPVPREDLVKIVEAGIMAPSGCNAQTTSFVIVDDTELLQKIAGVLPKTSVRTAKAIIAVISRHQAAYEGAWFDVQDYAAAVENILLAITALGYATVWLDGVLRHNHVEEKLARLLNVPGDQDMAVCVILPVGIPEEAGRQNSRFPFEQRAWFNRHP